MSNEYLFLPMAYCPKCDSVELKSLRGVRDQGDGTSLTRYRCLSCGHRFNVVYEPPLPKYGKDG